MEEYEKIISANSSGEINAIDYYTFEYIYDQKIDDIKSCDDHEERFRLMVELAVYGSLANVSRAVSRAWLDASHTNSSSLCVSF